VAGNVGIGIDGGGDHAAKFGGDECLRAWRRAAGVIAWLKRDESGSAVEPLAGVLLGFAQGDNFSVVEKIVFVPSLANDLAGAVEDDTTDGGIWRSDGDTSAR
jgi:hypothetical protein